MRHTKKILAATLSTIVLGSGLYTYKVIDDLHMKIDGLHVQLDEKERLIVEANKDIDQLVLSQNDLKDKLSYKEEEINVLNQTIEGKNNSIKSLQQQLEKAKKESEVLPRQVSRGSSNVVKTMNMELTFYTNSAEENGLYGGRVLTKTGFDITNTIKYQGYGIAASDPSVLPLYSIIEIEGLGKYVILDTGNAIKSNKLDILVGSKDEAKKRGRYTAKVNVLRIGK